MMLRINYTNIKEISSLIFLLASHEKSNIIFYQKNLPSCYCLYWSQLMFLMKDPCCMRVWAFDASEQNTLCRLEKRAFQLVFNVMLKYITLRYISCVSIDLCWACCVWWGAACDNGSVVCSRLFPSPPLYRGHTCHTTLAGWASMADRACHRGLAAYGRIRRCDACGPHRCDLRPEAKEEKPLQTSQWQPSEGQECWVLLCSFLS